MFCVTSKDSFARYFLFVLSLDYNEVLVKALMMITFLFVSSVSIIAQQSGFTQLAGQYLGQKPPGDTPIPLRK